ncbi:hypothetical protein AB0D78_07880 [Streptomyces avermitilis]|uniref:hypothetical protein n=1 Tax=Streptomyces avermitilis TaxID=33903 RepID=UPI0033B95EC8
MASPDGTLDSLHGQLAMESANRVMADVIIQSQITYLKDRCAGTEIFSNYVKAIVDPALEEAQKQNLAPDWNLFKTPEGVAATAAATALAFQLGLLKIDLVKWDLSEPIKKMVLSVVNNVTGKNFKTEAQRAEERIKRIDSQVERLNTRVKSLEKSRNKTQNNVPRGRDATGVGSFSEAAEHINRLQTRVDRLVAALG